MVPGLVLDEIQDYYHLQRRHFHEDLRSDLCKQRSVTYRNGRNWSLKEESATYLCKFSCSGKIL